MINSNMHFSNPHVCSRKPQTLINIPTSRAGNIVCPKVRLHAAIFRDDFRCTLMIFKKHVAYVIWRHLKILVIIIHQNLKSARQTQRGNVPLIERVEWNTVCNISNPTMRTGLDFKSARFDQVWGEAEYSPVRIGGFEMTAHTNKSPLKVRWINFDPVLGLH